MAAGITYARRLSDRFGVGFTAKYIQQTIWHESANAFAFDLGTLFRTDLLGGLYIGASLSNFGTDMKLEGPDMRRFAPVDPTKLGYNDQVPYTLEVESWDLPLLFQLGISFAPVRAEPYRWTVAADAIHQSDSHQSVNVGTEFAFHEFLFLRLGYHSLFLDEGEGGLSAGLGLTSSMLFSNSTVVQLFWMTNRLALLPESTRVRDDSLFIAGHSLASLSADYGTPLYIYDRATLDLAVRDLKSALQAYYPGASTITYAGKAFLCKAIAAWAQRHNLIVDCTVEGEIGIAVAGSVPRENILVHGVNKSTADLQAALQHAGTIVVDNLSELNNLYVILSEAKNLLGVVRDSSVARQGLPRSDINLWLRLL